MRRKTPKTRCTKLKPEKSKDVVHLYDPLMVAYAKKLENDPNIVSFECNVPLDGIEDDKFATDFLCKTADGEFIVRECCFRDKLLLPRMIHLLSASRDYWMERGVTDWGIVVEEVKEDEEG